MSRSDLIQIGSSPDPAARPSHGIAACGVACVDPAHFRGVLPLISASDTHAAVLVLCSRATTLTALARDDIPQLVRAIHECVKSIREIGVLLESL